MVTKPEIVNELQRLAAANDGLLKVADVVEAAKPASSPLHSWFQWDDSAAAHAYRLEQARRLIRVVIGYVGDDEDAIPVRVMVSLSQDRYSEGGYRSMAVVLARQDLRRALLEDAHQEMENFKQKYVQLKELSEVFKTMTKTQRIIRTQLGKRSKQAV